MKLHMQNYEILNFPTDNLVISEKGITKINSPSLLAALNKLQSHRVISKTKLKEILSDHGLNPESAYDFLEKALSIKEAISNLYFEKTIVAHDWGESSDLERLLKSELTTHLEIHKISEALKKVVSKKRCYIVILCMNYDYDAIKKLYFDLVDIAPESAISICYRAGNSYCISQPYMPKIGNPCHFCSINRLINYEDHQSSKNTWSKLLQFCKSRHIAVPAKPLNILQQALVVGALIKKIKLLTNTGNEHRYQDNILQETHIDFKGAYSRDISTSHWYMCDCLRLQK